jgi:hypothetical protein
MITMKIALSAVVLAVPLLVLITAFGGTDMEPPEWFMWVVLAALAVCVVAFFVAFTVAALLWVWAL